jgi:integral membrane sensor domain MASE1
MTSCHRCLGFPTVLVPIGFQSSSFPVGLARSILWICPSHLILCVLMNLTISAPYITFFILATDCISFVCQSLWIWYGYKWLDSRIGKERVDVLFHGAIPAFFCGMREKLCIT